MLNRGGTTEGCPFRPWTKGAFAWEVHDGLNVFSSFGYFADEMENQRALERVYRSLKASPSAPKARRVIAVAEKLA